jgi:hypothetical protein
VLGHPAVHVVDQIGHYSTRITIGLIVVLVLVGAARRSRQRRRRTE